MRPCLVVLAVALAGCGGKSTPETDTETVVAEPTCSRLECGEKPLLYLRCADGTGVGASSSCERAPDGKCGYIMEPCPTSPDAPAGGNAVRPGTAEPLGCLPEQCGPKPTTETMAICPDGRTTTRPTGNCVAIGDACGWEMSSCP